jgi:hypothetical protein
MSLKRVQNYGGTGLGVIAAVWNMSWPVLLAWAMRL